MMSFDRPSMEGSYQSSVGGMMEKGKEIQLGRKCPLELVRKMISAMKRKLYRERVLIGLNECYFSFLQNSKKKKKEKKKRKGKEKET